VKPLFLLALLLLAGCAQTPISHSGGGKPFGPLNPGGPIFQPVEVLVAEPMPTEPPFGKYFANDQPPVPAGLANPYWIAGYYGWKEPDWEWIPGRWVERPRPGVIWINPRYYHTGGQQYWVAGYWE
jgi:hypothetical protein